MLLELWENFKIMWENFGYNFAEIVAVTHEQEFKKILC